MKEIIEKKLFNLQEQMMEIVRTTEKPTLHPNYIILASQISILQETLSEKHVERAVHLQLLANKQIDVFGQAEVLTIAELTSICDDFNVMERDAFLRLMEESRK